MLKHKHALAILILAFPVSAHAARAVVVFAMDAVGYSFLRKVDARFVLEQQVSLIRPPKNSFTFPAAATLATGVWPEVHGVQSNDLSREEMERGISTLDGPERLKVKPVWIDAFQANKQVVVDGWFGSYGPWNGIHYRADKYYPPFREKSFSELTGGALRELRAWDGTRDLLFMAWTPGIDHQGHLTGPYSTQTINEWRSIRSQISRFEAAVSRLERDIRVIYVADHGMKSVSGGKGDHGFDPALVQEMYASIWAYPPLPTGRFPAEMPAFKEFLLSLFR